MNPLEKKLEKIREAETRYKMRSELASLIAGEALKGLQPKLASGVAIEDGDIAEVLRPIVDTKIDMGNKLFGKMAFSDLDDLYDEVTPLIYRGINLPKTEVRTEQKFA